jgi:glycosyltransferase involved in cell wall biosynthesis
MTSGMNTQLKVAFNVAVSRGISGGIEQSTVGLIDALGKLDGPEHYKLIVRCADDIDWLGPYIGPNQSFAVRPRPGMFGVTGTAARVLARLKQRARPLVRQIQARLSLPRDWPEVPISDGFIESLGCDVVHFPTQAFTLCALPSVYNPHDLQHLHYPQFFPIKEIVARETVYPAGCRYSHTVVVGTQWVKEDVIRRYGTDPAKVQVIPWAAPTHFYKEPTSDQVAGVVGKYGLQEPFALYPAQTWPHKNHLRLLAAVAHLRDARGLKVHLVCTGSIYKPHWPNIAEFIRQANLEEQVRFLGFVPEEDLRALYRRAHCLIMPSLYEADSCPVHEAWSEGVPVGCSNATALPDQVQDAGLLFDPLDVSAIADVLARLMQDDSLRDELRRRGVRRTRDFDWQRTAKAYRAVYRRAAGVPLTDEDRWLLEWDWMRHPEKAMALSR